MEATTTLDVWYHWGVPMATAAQAKVNGKMHVGVYSLELILRYMNMLTHAGHKTNCFFHVLEKSVERLVCGGQYLSILILIFTGQKATDSTGSPSSVL